MLLPCRGAVDAQTANQDRRAGPQSVQHRRHHLLGAYTVHAESRRVELGELHRIFLGRHLFPVHHLRVFPSS